MPANRRAAGRGGFTLLEMLVATAVLTLVLSLVLESIAQSSRVLHSASRKVEAFRGAREAFQDLTTTLSQATLGTYWDYDDPDAPQAFIRKSELDFQCGPNLVGSSQAVFFLAPAQRVGDVSSYEGLDGLLNACGYFVKYGPEPIPNLPHITAKNRYRLMRWVQNSEDLSVYDTSANWFANAAADGVPIADNVIALILWPKLSEKEGAIPGWTDSYTYDSRDQANAQPQPLKANQLPPLMQVSLVVIDERSAARLERLGIQESFVSSALAGLFEDTPDLKWSEDMETLKNRLNNPQSLNPLIKRPPEFRIFTSVIPLRESKWSKS